ncbi:MAG: hypothetical protein HeimC2_12840 [Candidatus Heimdallarchaeota archaeon LC_2]|nr:MAG: hypothetical protein HeimC2_12840 [Candidatus Heimdallarchaeota archaeon LC_2]
MDIIQLLILCIDVGKGTEDILLYQENQLIENSIQMILPSTAQLLVKKIERIKTRPLRINGDLMAGEPWHKSVYAISESEPNAVIMTKTAARSLRYMLDQVRSKGIKIVEDGEINDFDGPIIEISDVDWNRIFKILEGSGIGKKEITKVLLCCQDHGEPEDPKQSTRDFRMKTVYRDLGIQGRLEDLLFESSLIPDSLPRLKSIASSALRIFTHLKNNDVFVMDSSPAVILGAVRYVKDYELVVNVGNGHTLAVILKNKLVEAIYEIHTGGIKLENFIENIQRLAMGNLSHEETLKSGGHGVFIRNEMKMKYPEIQNLFPMSVIGPNRAKLKTLDIKYVNPGGNMMMAGPIGLLRAYHHLTGKQLEISLE